MIFVVAVTLNYLWELGQSPLYAGTEPYGFVLWHCFAAALGDGLLVLLIYAAHSTALLTETTLRALALRRGSRARPGRREIQPAAAPARRRSLSLRTSVRRGMPSSFAALV